MYIRLTNIQLDTDVRSLRLYRCLQLDFSHTLMSPTHGLSKHSTMLLWSPNHTTATRGWCSITMVKSPYPWAPTKHSTT